MAEKVGERSLEVLREDLEDAAQHLEKAKEARAKASAAVDKRTKAYNAALAELRAEVHASEVGYT